MLDQLVFDRNGYLLTSDVLANAISKHTLSDYVQKKGMERVAHGVYLDQETLLDDYYILYLRNKRIVFSLDSALYLHGLTDREPAMTTVTTPKGYNSSHLTKQGIKVIHTKWFELGMSDIQTNQGNIVPVYDKERTICDIIKNKKNIEIQTFQTAMKEYMNSSGKRIDNLMFYAITLGIEDKVRIYTEVML